MNENDERAPGDDYSKPMFWFIKRIEYDICQ